MASIDFRELRRRERQRIRSTSTKVDIISVAMTQNEITSSSSVAVNEESLPQQNICALTPFETLLPQQMLSEDIHQIKSASNIGSVFYAEQFLSPKVRDETMAWLQTIPDYLQTSDEFRTNSRLTEEEMSLQHNGKWTRLKHARRKVALFDGTLSSYELPPILQRMSDTLVSIGAFPSSNPPNHVLINEYQPGEGIMPHTDGPAYDSCTATISLGGSHVIFKLRPRQHYAAHENCERTLNDQQKLDIILHGSGSLIVFQDDAYLEHTHEISEGVFEEITESGICGNDLSGGTIVKRGYRISLTFRCKK